jgi:hypothetical protein
MVNGYYAADVRVLTAMGDSIGSAFVVLRSEHDAAVSALAAELRESRQDEEDTGRDMGRYRDAAIEAEARVKVLEAALRDVLTFADITKPVDADALSAKVRAAWQVLGSTAETPAKYGTCPECSGQGGAHFTTCSHSPANRKVE